VSFTQKNKVRLSGIAVVFMLVIVPIVSYVFLRKGFEYRKDSITQLEEKVLDADLKMHLSKYAPHVGNAQLIHIPSSQNLEEQEVIIAIDDKIVDRDRFDIISFTKDKDTEDDQQIKFVPAGRNIETPYSFILIDTADVVRGVYPYDGDVGKELMRHLSVVIPVPQRRTITLKRD